MLLAPFRSFFRASARIVQDPDVAVGADVDRFLTADVFRRHIVHGAGQLFSEIAPRILEIAPPGRDFIGLVIVKCLAPYHEIADPFAAGGSDFDVVRHVAQTAHVPALLIKRVGVEHVVGDVFEKGADLFSPQLERIDVRIGDTGHLIDVVHRDRITAQNGCPPAVSGGERNVRIHRGDDGVVDQFVERRMERIAFVEGVFGHPQDFAEFPVVGFVPFRDQRVPFGIGGDQVRCDGDEFVLYPLTLWFWMSISGARRICRGSPR